MTRLGAVVIGRNEGARFRRCLQSIAGCVDPIVYVDSGSVDGSVEHARDRGVDVVELSASIPFTAARARNAGFRRIMEIDAGVELLMFVDGDCEVDPEWLPAATRYLEEHRDYAVACGRRRERRPDATVYNYLCDVEWNTPIGDADACGGDAMMRTDALTAVDGFNSNLIAGEEPELCARLRAAGWRIRRLDAEMTLHDANISTFSQWWTRTVRAGHAYAEVSSMTSGADARHRRNKSVKAIAWGLLLPVAIVGLLPFATGVSLALLLLYPLNIARIAMRLKTEGEPRPWTVASFLMLAKLPEAIGWMKHSMGRLTGKRSRLIEYKSS